MKTTLETPSAPWWRFPIMWLVVAGPLAVVLASFVTAWLAIDGADASLANTPKVRDVARGDARQRSNAPAQQARNHAATSAAAPAEPKPSRP